jgi:hypothetical protein
MYAGGSADIKQMGQHQQVECLAAEGNRLWERESPWRERVLEESKSCRVDQPLDGKNPLEGASLWRDQSVLNGTAL